MASVEIYTKTFCPYCWKAKALLESKGLAYREISVDFGGEVRQQMIQRANGQTTVPQIFIREEQSAAAMISLPSKAVAGSTTWSPNDWIALLSINDRDCAQRQPPSS